MAKTPVMPLTWCVAPSSPTDPSPSATHSSLEEAFARQDSTPIRRERGGELGTWPADPARCSRRRRQGVGSAFPALQSAPSRGQMSWCLCLIFLFVCFAINIMKKASGGREGVPKFTRKHYSFTRTCTVV